MPNWKTTCKWIVVISLMFFAVPVKVPKPAQPGEEVNRKLFENYVKKFNKTYLSESEEYNKRYGAFKTTLSQIETLNSARLHSQAARYGLTRYSDLTKEEFLLKHLDKAKRLTFKRQQHNKRIWLQNTPNVQLMGGSVSGLNQWQVVPLDQMKRLAIADGLPLKVDWRERGVISSVKDQGLCGACWAYTTIETAEAMAAIKTNHIIDYSVQQMIDCAKGGNFGCLGGDICTLLQWLVRNNVTIETEKDYPTVGRTSVCKMKNVTNGIRINNFNCLSLKGTEQDIIRWIALDGPVAVAVNALSWQNYLGGVIQHHCPGDLASLNHAVQIVGYDLTAEIPYYIAKNSWGTTFGLKGYLHMAIGENICGVANEVAILNVV